MSAPQGQRLQTESPAGALARDEAGTDSYQQTLALADTQEGKTVKITMYDAEMALATARDCIADAEKEIYDSGWAGSRPLCSVRQLSDYVKKKALEARAELDTIISQLD